MSSSQHQYLITGATGFIGSEVFARFCKKNKVENCLLLCRRKPEASKSLLGLRLKSHGFDESFFSKISFFECDFSDPKFFQSFLRTLPLGNKAWKVLHMAAYIHASDSQLSLQERINQGVTQDLLDFAFEKNAAHFIYLSSIVAFGGFETSQIRKEKDFSKFSAGSLAFSYFRTKREAHEYLLKHSQLPTSILCPGVVHGSLEHFKDSRSHLRALREGRLKWAPSGGSNFVALDRVAEAIVESAEVESLSGIKTQLLVDQNLSYKKYFELYVEISRKEQAQKIRKIPYSLGVWIRNVVLLLKKIGLSLPSALEGLSQGSYFLFFESEEPLPPSKGLEAALQDSLNCL